MRPGPGSVVAEAAGLIGQDGGDPSRMRHWLEAGGVRCLLAFDNAAGQIAAATDTGRVVINSLFYAEVSVGYETVEELDELLPLSDYEREPLPCAAGFAAGKAFVRYRRDGGDKRSPMPGFYIGAHAAR